VTLTLAAGGATAQELEPRAYTAAPMGSNAVLFSYTHSSGGVLTDPTLPIEDLNAQANALVAGYYRAFPLFGKSAAIGLSAPYVFGDVSGKLEGVPDAVTRSGLGDARLKFTLNLMGAPPMTAREYLDYRQKTIVGVSLVVNPPVGQYDPNKLVNLGTNRWVFKPEVGLSHAMGRTGRWVLDVYAGLWLFTTNQDFLGQTRKQAPLATTQFHLNYRVRPRLWASFDYTFYPGGRTEIAGEESSDLQVNSRIGGTVSVPLSGGHSLKISVSTGVLVRAGGDFDSFAVGYQYSWIEGL